MVTAFCLVLELEGKRHISSVMTSCKMSWHDSELKQCHLFKWDEKKTITGQQLWT